MKPIAIFRHSAGEGPGYFATFLERHNLPWQLIAVDAGDALPAEATGYSGLVFMGGPMSVNDPLPWIEQELALIRAAAAHDIPVLGHCLGGQLMAKAMGAAVTRNPQKEIGWGEVKTSKHDAARDWLGDQASFTSFHWHGETFGIPPGATRILGSEACTNQAFVIGPHLGMQCHVEMTEDMIAEWGRIGADEIAANPCATVQSAADMLGQAPQYLGQMRAAADRLYTRWIAGLKS